MTSPPSNHVIGGFRSDLPFKRKREVFILVSMDYYKNLKVEDFDCYQTYWLGRVLRGLPAGYAILTSSVTRLVTRLVKFHPHDENRIQQLLWAYHQY